MKKIVLIMCLFLISYPVVADDYNGYNDNCVSNNNKQQSNQEDSDDYSLTQSPWDEMYNQAIDERYGSVESPAFLNRENIDPEEANTGFSN